VKIGRFVITRVRRTQAGLDIYPWQALTEDRVSPELRQVVAKVARSEVKNYLQEQAEAAPARVCVSSHCVENDHMYMDPRENA
jgi:hypothetical protein